MLVLAQVVNNPTAKSFFSRPELLWSVVALLAIVLIGAGVIYLARRWRSRLLQPPTPPEGEVEHYQALLDRGELSREEFERITGLLAQRGREQPESPPQETGFTEPNPRRSGRPPGSPGPEPPAS